jgi:carbon storage regulator
MLVLTRKLDERIRIGADIEVCIVQIRGDKVRIGIEAPKEVPIMRTELVGRTQPGAPARHPGPGRWGRCFWLDHLKAPGWAIHIGEDVRVALWWDEFADGGTLYFATRKTGGPGGAWKPGDGSFSLLSLSSPVTISVGPDTEISLKAVSHDRVQVGVKAPSGTSVKWISRRTGVALS